MTVMMKSWGCRIRFTAPGADLTSNAAHDFVSTGAGAWSATFGYVSV